MARTSSILMFFLSSFALTETAPHYRHVTTDDAQEQIKIWLVKYGYLRHSEDVTSLEHINAIANMQSFYKLPITGVVGSEEYFIMQQPRCGFPDMVGKGDAWNAVQVAPRASGRVRRFSINRERQRWSSNFVTYRFINFTSDLPSSQQSEAVEKAAQKWSAVSGLTISKSSSSTADIDLSFNRQTHGDPFSFDGRSGILAHAFFPGGGLGGDIHFDDDEFFTTERINPGAVGTDFTYVTLHELGHSLGLDHSNIPEAVMSTTFVATTADIQLHRDDIAGIQFLYGAPPGGTVVTSGEVDPPAEPICAKVYDAVAATGAALFFFHENRLFQANDAFVSHIQPLSLEVVFPGGPTSVDAAFVSGDSVVTLFKGSTYWKYDLNNLQLDPSTPSSISDFGLSTTSIDAVSNTFGRLSFFKDNLYWTYFSTTGLAGPFSIQGTWSQVTVSSSSPLTSVFYRQSDDRMYFVRGSEYWAYNSQRQLVDSGNFNTVTQNLCRWCQARPGSDSSQLTFAPKVLLTSIVISGLFQSWIITG
ncbi:Matrix metalloproteinase-24 [Holothuria leucospilota]|uniref:Matrix metalloproteinase-24 n=1 Tax=Holothuria leucospilota TaxID=206669 RepID=A0A9Q1CE01_HOLLE|nr:Matrix metalloproteinase-24 [Holothuria leucospilota]